MDWRLMVELQVRFHAPAGEWGHAEATNGTQ